MALYVFFFFFKVPLLQNYSFIYCYICFKLPQRTSWTKLLIDCQPDARLAAEEEGKRLEELHREAERERREQLQKAHLRGSHALKKVHLAQVGKVVVPDF